MNKRIYIIGGGTVSHVRNHLALCALAYGTTARSIADICRSHPDNKMDVVLHLTKMAGGHDIETNNDVDDLITDIICDPLTKIVFMNAALVDFNGDISDPYSLRGPHAGDSHKYASRLSSSENKYWMVLHPEDKLIGKIRRTRKDIFLVGFKATCGATKQEQFEAGLRLCKQASCNLVLANDTKTRHNMIITPEEAAYHETSDRNEALTNLVDMALQRSHLTFTRSTVVAGDPVPWDSQEVPASLRAVVDHCIKGSAYKPFKGATVGHFAVKLGPQEFLTSKRKTDFNKLSEIGLVRVKTDGPDSVIAYGAKPSVGGQSQRIVFQEHQEYDCIAHFHSPLKAGHRDDIPVVSQRGIECGSMQCGANTSGGLRKFGNLSAVMLDMHGPNIVFHRSIDPKDVIDFIEANFDLSQKTGGYNLSK